MKLATRTRTYSPKVYRKIYAEDPFRYEMVDCLEVSKEPSVFEKIRLGLFVANHRSRGNYLITYVWDNRTQDYMLEVQ